MEDARKNDIKRIDSKVLILEEMFDRYPEDLISDEQAERTLEPVLRMIQEGWYDLPSVISLSCFRKPEMSITTAVILVMLAVFTQSRFLPNRETFPYNPSMMYISSTVSDNSITGKIYIESHSTRIKLQLVDVDSMKTIMTTTTDDDGMFTFSGFKDGVYRLKVLLQDGMIKDAEMKGYISINGNADIVFDSNSHRDINDLEIVVWTTR